ncbi:sodium/mannose cotransporter SLC5A10-like isoform X1 [Clavelina lepadiformis]|uniref:sodium/mannose cotransporter SLC5A10-like isoform X1 n=1 Tax=Clavelina lepadiformis TaxID=159417 RepID=UPI0040421056
MTFNEISTVGIASEPSTTEQPLAESARKGDLGVSDIIIVVAYIVITFAVGIWASRRGENNSLQGYFMAGRHAFWLPIGASLFVSNIGTAHFIGLAGTGAATGIAVANFEWLAAYVLLELGWLFLPIYLASKVYTMPEYLHKRYGGSRLRVTLSIISLAIYVLTKIAVDLYSGALFIKLAFNVNVYLAIVTVLIVTAVYTMLGGLKAVIYTDTLQTFVMIAGGIMVTVICYMKVGSWENFVSLYMASIPQSTVDILVTGNNTTCGVPGADSFHMLRDPATSDLPWTGIMTGMFCFGSYYFCCDQVIVQRALAAKNLQHAKIGCVFAGFLKIIPMYMMVMTGMTSRILFPDEVACADPKECKRICGNEQGCWNIAYPKLLLEVLPTGLRGIVIAAMLSALMSSLTSIFNSASTIFTLDIWKRIRTNCSEREMLIVGKLTVLVLVVISILWVPIVSSVGGQLWTYLNAVLSALGSPIFVIYFLGILFPRVNEKGAFWGLMIGLAVGATRLGLDFFYKVPLCGEEDTRPAIIAKINYLHVSPIVFFLSAAIAIVVSFLTDPPSPELLINTTWFTLHNDKEAAFTKGTGTIRDEEGRSQSNPLNQKTGTTAKFRKYDLRNCFLNASAIMLSLTIAFLVGYHA